jgi:hypothetical protein
VTEPLLKILRRAEAALLARSTALLCSNGLDPAVLDQAEGVARQLEDRAAQCASWAFSVERWGADIQAEHEASIRSSCEDWLRMIEEG